MILLIATLVTAPAEAVEAPASIKDARIEIRAASPAAVLAEVGRGKTGEWVGWSVAALSGAGDMCCFSSHFKRSGCSLSDRDNSWGSSDNDLHKGTQEMYVFVESKNGQPSRVRIVSPDCPLDGADRRVVWLGPVETRASLDALAPLLDVDSKDDRVAEPALAAVAYHADPKADAVIEKRALDRRLSTETRQQAIFWAGHARGEAGYRLVERIVSSDPSGEIRQHAVFALTQSPVPGSVDRIKRVALEDRDDEVRSQALFWLAQTKAPGAGEWIFGRLDAERDDHVREQAVFALSQLPDGTDWLLKVLRSKRDPETVRRALFWLGQSDDPRALAEIKKILER